MKSTVAKAGDKIAGIYEALRASSFSDVEIEIGIRRCAISDIPLSPGNVGWGIWQAFAEINTPAGMRYLRDRAERRRGK